MSGVNWTKIDSSEVGAGPRAAEETSDEYRPITNLSYRGAMDPDMVQGEGEDEWTGHTASEDKGEQQETSNEQGLQSSRSSSAQPVGEKVSNREISSKQRQDYGQAPLEQLLNLNESQRKKTLNAQQVFSCNSLR